MVAPLWEAVALAHYVYFYKELFRADTDCLSAFYGISVVDCPPKSNHISNAVKLSVKNAD